ncbi:hypothetical protein HNP33_000549 [Comamonas odontotermitis]|uniref:Secreted protein n=1 Tax=Comamonas odontotermitis TaxID=379895 RepID=A0ABR6RBK2_9BURK|nr:hypothetical protein [Comamonas odontotermitis]MBB6576501.1 hypothetical protein [Comamonas odontotermitis]
MTMLGPLPVALQISAPVCTAAASVRTNIVGGKTVSVDDKETVNPALPAAVDGTVEIVLASTGPKNAEQSHSFSTRSPL